MDKKAMYKLSYGLFVLTAKEDSKDNGCIINTAIQAASEPNQLSICVNKLNYTLSFKDGYFTIPSNFNTNAFLAYSFTMEKSRDFEQNR